MNRGQNRDFLGLLMSQEILDLGASTSADEEVFFCNQQSRLRFFWLVIEDVL